MAPVSMLVEVAGGLRGRALRSALTGLGIAIGVAALVASIGVSQSAGGRIVTRFHDTQATSLVATNGEGAPLIQPAAVEAARSLAGIESTSWVSVHGGGVVTRSRAPAGSASAVVQSLTVLGARPDLPITTGAHLASGRFFDAGHEARGARVAVIGSGAANRLGIGYVDGRASIDLGGSPFLVIGVVDEVEFFDQALNSVVVPHTTAAAVLGPPESTTALVATAIGSTYVVAGQLPYALSPTGPDQLQVSVPPPPPDVAAAVGSDLDALSLTLAGLGALVAAISVAAIMTVNVMERIPEIGLRRALGASRFSIAVQFLGESTFLGVAGGLVGAALGLAFIVGAAELRAWTPILSPEVPYLALALGAGIGTLSGAYPAVRASRIAPAASLAA